MTFNLLVIGSTVLDIIEQENLRYIKPGGIFYTCLGLVSIKMKNEHVALITNYDRENFKHFQQVFEQVDMRYSSVIEKISTVHLKIWKDKERTETYCNASKQLKIPANLNFSLYNGILINMISGLDISLEQLKYLRRIYSGLIYIDLHTLTRKKERKKELIQTQITDADEWLRNVDIVQVNEKEAFSIISAKTVDEVAEFVLQFGVKFFIVTRGSNGVTLFRRTSGYINIIQIPGVSVKSANNVGCGDIFGSVFFYSYIKTNDCAKALHLANKAAGKSTEYSENYEYINLKKIFEEKDDQE